MAEERPREEQTGSEDDVQAAFHVVVSAQERLDEPADSDELLLERFEQVRVAIARTLTLRALRRFGPAYTVRVLPGEVGGSIRSTVLLAIRYPVRKVAATLDELRRFAGDIELELTRALAADGSVQVVAELDEASVEESGDQEVDSRGSWDQIAPILAAVATGIGVLGLVTFVGGAIDWARFQATGLPREQALSVVPTQDLVVVGARTLVPAVFGGLLACALYAIGSVLLGNREQRGLTGKPLAYVEEHGATSRALFLASAVGLGELAAFLVTLESPSSLQFAVFVMLGGLLVLLTYAVAKQTDRFPFLAVTVFLALSIFLGGIAYARALSTPELRAAAIIRNNQKAILGFFVAENGDRVYLARLDPRRLKEGVIDRSSARLIGVAKSEITDIEVGSPAEPSAAFEQAHSLADELCEQEIARPLNPKLSRSTQKCWEAPAGKRQVPPS